MATRAQSSNVGSAQTGAANLSRPAVSGLNGGGTERQRVKRACENCRKKKIKCDGEEPCQRCKRDGRNGKERECVYLDWSKSVDVQNIERLESRMSSMETLFRQFIARFEGGELILRPESGSVSSSRVGNDNEPSGAKAANTGRIRRPRSNELDPALNGSGTAAVGNEDGIHFECDDPPITDLVAVEVEDHTEDTGASDSDSHDHGYADGFGELDMDVNGQLRYVGLGSTASVVDTCVGLRRHINSGLEKKGYEAQETFFTSPQANQQNSDGAVGLMQNILNEEMPPASLVNTLFEIWAKDILFLFPILLEADVRAIHIKLLTQETVDTGYAAVFFAVLAVASPLLPQSHEVYDKIDFKYRDTNMGSSFYNLAMYFCNSSSTGKSERKGKSQDTVAAVGLMSLYLAEIGSQAEAWIMVGRAIRLGQDLGLHRSPERLQLPSEERSKRRYIWWCLYILERQLSTALGRPISIDDDDCDVEIPSISTDGQRSVETGGFVSLIHLNKILGTILKTVNSVRNADNWREVRKYDELRIRVRDANTALQTWAKDQVPSEIKIAKSGTLLAEKHILLSCFFTAVMLLHRVFMTNPHRPSPLENLQAQLECSKAATNCIRGTPEFLRNVPKSQYLIFELQSIFVSAILLLQCIRTSKDSNFISTALEDVKSALQYLGNLDNSWEGAKKCRGIVEEYLEFTVHVLEGDRRGVCQFEHGVHKSHKTSRRRERSNQAPRSSKRKHVHSLPETTSTGSGYHLNSRSAEPTTKRTRVVTQMIPQMSPELDFEDTNFDAVVGTFMSGVPDGHLPPDQLFSNFDFDFATNADFWQWPDQHLW